MNENKNFGLIIPEITPDNWILGGAVFNLKGIVINPSGNWLPFMVKKEPQNIRGIETQNCVSYATLNCVETLQKFNGLDVNYSDRYLGIMADTNPYKGNSPHTVAQTIRNLSGCIDEYRLPFSDDIKIPEDYYKPKPVPPETLKDGQSWWDKFELSHEWCFQNGTPAQKKIKLQEALTKGTVACSVYAWVEQNGIYIKPQGTLDNHWIQLLRIDEEGYYIIFDSYDNYVKKLAKDYDFAIAKVYYLSDVQARNSIMEKMIALMKKVIGLLSELIIRKKEEVIPPVKLVEPIVEPKYLWDNYTDVRHSVRVICDEAGLSWDEKALICSVIKAESNFDTKAVNKNSNTSTDWGICQFNDGPPGVPSDKKWWIGEGKTFETFDECLNNPERCVRIMIGEYKRGNLKYWTAWKNSSYKKYL